MLITKKPSISEGPSNGHLLPPAPFIVGVGRSGTTMFRLMLDAHPELAIPPATSFICRVIKDCEVASSPRDCFVEVLTSEGTWPDFHISADSLRRRIMGLSEFNVGNALRTFYQLYAERLGKPRWGDKATKNMSKMTVLQTVLPEARFIHLIRDGRDVALSRSKWIFRHNSIRETAERWVSKIRQARRQARNLSHYMEIRYEDLVLHTESTLKEVCDFIDLPWDPAMLDYYKTSKYRIAELQDCIKGDGRFLKAEERRRKYQLTTKPPERDRIGCWKKEMNDADKECFQSIAGELLEDLGYEAAIHLRTD